jgi:hypothetical protein
MLSSKIDRATPHTMESSGSPQVSPAQPPVECHYLATDTVFDPRYIPIFLFWTRIMRRLTTKELLFLQDMCLDAEFRCHERAITAQIKGDGPTATREFELKEQYGRLKQAILDDLYARGNHEPLDAPLLKVRTGIKEDMGHACNDAGFVERTGPMEKRA